MYERRLLFKQGGLMFETYKLNEKGGDEVCAFKAIIFESVEECLRMMPDCREKQIFKTKIEEACFFGTRAIAAKEGNFSEVVPFRVGNR